MRLLVDEHSPNVVSLLFEVLHGLGAHELRVLEEFANGIQDHALFLLCELKLVIRVNL